MEKANRDDADTTSETLVLRRQLAHSVMKAPTERRKAIKQRLKKMESFETVIDGYVHHIVLPDLEYNMNTLDAEMVKAEQDLENLLSYIKVLQEAQPRFENQARKSQIILSLPFFKMVPKGVQAMCRAASTFDYWGKVCRRCVVQPAPSVTGCKTRLESE